MIKKRLSYSSRKCYSPQEKRKIVDEIRSGIKTIEQSSKACSVPLGQLRKWNRWYFKMRILRYFRSKPLKPMLSKDQEIEQMKKQLQKSQALVDKLQLKTIVLEKAIEIAGKELKVDIGKKPPGPGMVPDRPRNQPRIPLKWD